MRIVALFLILHCVTLLGSQQCFGPSAAQRVDYDLRLFVMLVMWDLCYLSICNGPVASNSNRLIGKTGNKHFLNLCWRVTGLTAGWVLPLSFAHVNGATSVSMFVFLCARVHCVWFVLWRRPAFQLCSPIKISFPSAQP